MPPRTCPCCGKPAETCVCQFDNTETDTEHQYTWCSVHQHIVEKTLDEVELVDEAELQA